MAELARIATSSLAAHTNERHTINRIDVRPKKGIVKVTFRNNIYGVQIDAATGEVLQIAKRHSDLIENIHDGSYIDGLMGWKSGIFKLIYTTVMGLSLLLFCLTGFWLWYGPKRMRRLG